MQEPFNRLAEIVRTSRTVLAGAGTVEPENPIWVEFAHSMAPMMAPMAAPLGEIAVEGLDGPIRVLDIAAGLGLFGIEVAKRNPAAHVVAVDSASRRNAKIRSDRRLWVSVAAGRPPPPA